MSQNDEPVVRDDLGHNILVRRVGHRVLLCEPPYVIGVCGSWGAGKTSFLRKLWMYLGGENIWEEKARSALGYHDRLNSFVESESDFKELTDGRKLELIWFSPWQHQFESSPLVALLNEIRQHFSRTHKLFDGTGKIANVATHSLLNSMGELAKDLKLPLPTAKTVMERGREYEAEHFSSALTSQRFREFFENAIKTITKDKGLLVIFIDDLDRCEGEVAYRLLEALKLYLNAGNCVYVLGLDQQQLEHVIAKALSGEKETWQHRPAGRDYLSKMFQAMFPLPVPRLTENYVRQLLGIDFLPPNEPPKTKPDQRRWLQKDRFEKLLNQVFDFQAENLSPLVSAMNNNLPHNPRKIKSFVSSWRLYLEALFDRNAGKLDWRLTLILHYLAQFEEPLFRKVEVAPDFYNDEIVPFCLSGFNAHPLFHGLEIPYEMSKSGGDALNPEESTGFDPPPPPVTIPQESGAKKDEPKRMPEPRIFWIANLVRELSRNESGIKVDRKQILRHLLHTGDALPPEA